MVWQFCWKNLEFWQMNWLAKQQCPILPLMMVSPFSMYENGKSPLSFHATPSHCLPSTQNVQDVISSSGSGFSSGCGSKILSLLLLQLMAVKPTNSINRNFIPQFKIFFISLLLIVFTIFSKLPTLFHHKLLAVPDVDFLAVCMASCYAIEVVEHLAICRHHRTRHSYWGRDIVKAKALHPIITGDKI